MKDKLKDYIRFFKLLRRDQEKKYEQYANTALNTLFTDGRAFYGEIVGATDFGQLILQFATSFTPRLKVPMCFCVVSSKAFEAYGSSIARWECSSLKFRENETSHTSFSDVLPIYYLSHKKNTIGCGQIRTEMVEAVRKALQNKKRLNFVMLETLPPTELLKNLAEYIEQHPNDENLLLEPLRTYDDWHPTEVSKDDDIAQKVIAELDKKGICVVQGPPGTGKSYTLGEIISRLTAQGQSVCVTTQSNASLISLVSQETMLPVIQRGAQISKTVLSAEEKKKHPFLIPADPNLSIAKGTLLCSTYYSLSRIINITEQPKYDLIVIEEASQAFLTAIDAFRRLGKKCLIVGDPMQLPPVVDIVNEDDYRGIDIDTQANGMMTCVRSLDLPSFRITTSHRLTAKSTSQSKYFYGGNLTSVQQSPTIFNVNPEISPFFPEEGGSIILNTKGSSSANCSRDALDVIRKIVTLFADYYPKRRLAILSPFVLTTQFLQKEFCEEKQELDLLVDTINRIQGETVDYTIYYIPLRNHNFAFSENLFNVATSRSRSTTLIITDMPIDAIPINSQKVLSFIRSCKIVDMAKKNTYNRTNIKDLYPGLETLVDQLLDNNIEFSFDGDVELLDYNGIVRATAGMLLTKYKIAIDPIDKASEQEFLSEGYKVVSSREFDINMLK